MGGISALIGSKSASKAADAQMAAAEQATDAMLEMYYKSREDQAPWREAGKMALNTLILGKEVREPSTTERRLVSGGGAVSGGGYTKLVNGPVQGSFLVPDADLIRAGQNPENFPGYQTSFGGAGPETVNQIPPGYRAVNEQSIKQMKLPGMETYEDVAVPGKLVSREPGILETGPGEFTESPYYNFLLEEGNKELARSQSARGILDSGAAQREAQRYGKGLASTEYQNWIQNWLQTKVNPLLSVSGMGQVATSATTNAATQTGSQVGQNIMRAGDATASGYINQANAITGGINSMMQGANNAMFYNYLTQPQQQPAAIYQPSATQYGSPGYTNSYYPAS